MSDQDNPAPAKSGEPPAVTAAPGGDPVGMSLSMHAGVDASCDCCSCEAEPYWLEAMAEPSPRADGR